MALSLYRFAASLVCRRALAIAIVAVCALFPAFADAETIASFDFADIGGSYGILTALDISFVEDLMGADATLSWTVSPSDVGKTLYYDSSNNASFTDVVSFLTNGDDNFMMFASSGSNEASKFAGVVGGNGIDLQGFSITQIGLEVNSLSLISPGANPNHDGQWTDISSTFTLRFEGTPAVPEPSTYVMALAGLACGSYSMFRRRKRA